MIYFDNAATTFKKPKEVIKAVNNCLTKYCANSGRSSYKIAVETAEKIYEARESVARLLGLDTPERVVFGQNATHSLNLAILTTVEEGTHLLISDVEHNAVYRPVYSLWEKGIIDYSIFSSEGDIRKNITSLIRENTKYIVSNLSSNVTGKEIPLDILSKVSREFGLTLIVDASQLIGHKRLDLKTTPCDVLCAPSHKALFGIQGAGFAVISDNIKRTPIITGGSGSHSLLPYMPDELPERFEAGTLPSPSIISLLYGIRFIEKTGIENIEERLEYLSGAIIERLHSLKGVIIYEADNGVVSFNVDKVPCVSVSEELSRENVCVRSGWHCAPLAHKRIGTERIGTVRISLSYFNTIREVDAFYRKMRRILRKIL